MVPGHIGNRSFRTHRLHFWAKRVVQRLQGSFLQVDVAQIIIHKTDQPDPFFDFLETNGLTGEHRAEIHFLAVQADASAAGDLDARVALAATSLSFTPTFAWAFGSEEERTAWYKRCRSV
jgi:hypothetical protein